MLYILSLIGLGNLDRCEFSPVSVLTWNTQCRNQYAPKFYWLCFESSVSLIFFKAKFWFIKLHFAHCLGFYRLHWQTLVSSNQPMWSFLNSHFEFQFACAIWRHQLFRASPTNDQRISQVSDGNWIITQLDSVSLGKMGFWHEYWASNLSREWWKYLAICKPWHVKENWPCPDIYNGSSSLQFHKNSTRLLPTIILHITLAFNGYICKVYLSSKQPKLIWSFHQFWLQISINVNHKSFWHHQQITNGY